MVVDGRDVGTREIGYGQALSSLPHWVATANVVSGTDLRGAFLMLHSRLHNGKPGLCSDKLARMLTQNWS